MLLISGLYGGCFGDWKSIVVIPEFTKIDTITFLVIGVLFTFVYVKIKRNKQENIVNTNQHTVELDVFMQPKNLNFKNDKSPFSEFSPVVFYVVFLILIILLTAFSGLIR